MILQEYNYISSKRIAYFYSSKPEPHQFTVVVRSIPVSVGSSISNSIETFFREYHPSTYLSHTVVHRTNKLRGLIVSIYSDVYYPCSVGMFSVLPLLKMKFFFLKTPINCQEILSLVLDYLNDFTFDICVKWNLWLMVQLFFYICFVFLSACNFSPIFVMYFWRLTLWLRK